MKFKVLSLFDGIAGARQALKNLNIDCEYYASEIDKYAIEVAKANHPNILHLGDVKNLFKYHHFNDGKYSQFYNMKRGEIDLLIGGSPCQDLSIAKKDRKGLDGDRSSLFYEYVRILNETKPKYFILENVASMSKESKESISKELFSIEPILINSSLLTAQQRKRLYWIGILQRDGSYKKVEINQPKDKYLLLKNVLESGVGINNKSNCITATYYKCSGLRDYLRGGRPVVAEPIRLDYFDKGSQGDRIYSIKGKSVSLSANGGGRGAKTGLYKIDLADGDYIIRKLTPTECCRLQGFPDSYVSMVSNTQAYKALGNSFTVPVIEHIIKNLKYEI